MQTFKNLMLKIEALIAAQPHLHFLKAIVSLDLVKITRKMKSAPLLTGTDCSGIEAPIMALNLMNVPHHHLFSSDIDKNCRETIERNYSPHTIFTDITKRDHSKLPRLDAYVAGFPCQAFSGLNNRAEGFDDPRGTIFFECFETIRYTKPKFFILENVKGLMSHDRGRTFNVIMEKLHSLKTYNIHYKLLNTKDFDLPQNRPRIYIVGIDKRYGNNFNFPESIEGFTKVSDIMDELDYRDSLSDNMKIVVRDRLEKKGESPGTRKNYIVNAGVSSKGGFGSAILEMSPCLLAGAHSFYSTSHKRFLTSREFLRLQGFSDEFKEHPNSRVSKKQAGNSMSVNVLAVLFKQILIMIN